MHVERLATATSFLAAVEPSLLANEAENGLILGLARRLARGGAPTTASYCALVRDERGVLLCGLGSRAHTIVITRALDPAAIARLAADVHAGFPDAAEALGPEPTVATFAHALAARSSRRAILHVAQRIHAATAVTLPDPIAPGALRLAREADLPIVTRFCAGFLADIGESGDPAREEAERIANGALHVWDDHGPVAMAATARKTPTGIAINHVYTPPEQRNHGYASACVATLTQRQLDAGNRFVCLYTDAANPTANAIYHRLGYRALSDAGSYVLR